MAKALKILEADHYNYSCDAIIDSGKEQFHWDLYSEGICLDYKNTFTEDNSAYWLIELLGDEQFDAMNKEELKLLRANMITIFMHRALDEEIYLKY